MPQNPIIDHARGVGSREDSDKRNQGNQDNRRNLESDPVGRKALNENRSLYSHPQQFYHHESGQYYWYDYQTDTFILQNGRRVPRNQGPPFSSLIPTNTQNSVSLGTGSYSLPRHTSQAVSTGRSANGYDHTAPRSNQQAPANILAQAMQGMVIDDRSVVPPLSPSEQVAPRAVRMHVRGDSGQSTIDLEDPVSGVHVAFQDGPINIITDASLLTRGIHARRLVYSPDGDKEDFSFPKYCKQSKPEQFFIPGKVFQILWIEPTGESEVNEYEADDLVNPSHAQISAKFRRFVVIRDSLDRCSALPITSYNEQGVGQLGVVKSEHSIIHTGRNAPEPTTSELPVRGELGLRKAIRVDADQRECNLGVMPRLNYGEVYTVKHDVRVKSFGMVSPDSISTLSAQFANVWSAKRGSTIRPEDYQATRLSRVGSQQYGPANGAGSRAAPAISTSRDTTGSNALAITDEQMRQSLRDLAGYAAQRGLRPPQNLSSGQIHGLANNPQARADYLQRIKEAWGLQSSGTRNHSGDTRDNRIGDDAPSDEEASDDDTDNDQDSD